MNKSEKLTMVLQIRRETESDYRAVEEVAREAFWNLYCPGCSEHYVIHTMRQDPAFLPGLTFVIESEGRILGSIFYTKSKVVMPNGNEIDTITFGPVSVHPKFHRQGIGRKLISHSIEAAKKEGHRAIITMGYPYHYEPYGFTGGKNYGITMPDGKFYKGLLVLPLFEGALDGISGYVKIGDILEPDLEKAEIFDLAFEHKGKMVLPSQMEYERSCAELDE